MAARFGAVLRAMMSSMPSGRFTGGAVLAAGGLAATAYGVNASLYNGALGRRRQRLRRYVPQG